MEKIKYTPISREEMMAKHMDDTFWYVLDLSEDPPIVVANPFVDEMAERAFIFQEQEDAKEWARVISKTMPHQDHKLGIQGDLYRSLLKDEEEEFGRFPLTAINHEEAQKLLSNYTDYLHKSEAGDNPS
jgi:hypothetical protein